uniref:sortilin-related receptor-like n=1 Tax=Styela clava TaxID=7725 RepID=UPI00193A8E2F|nr:sortilin-related receptor-like [Styela clava]
MDKKIVPTAPMKMVVLMFNAILLHSSAVLISNASISNTNVMVIMIAMTDLNELNCGGGTSECNSDLSFKCQTKLYGDRCVPKIWKCDGEVDCDDGADEKNCGNNTCSEYQFGCGDGTCIFNFWKCDGDNDCNNGADEKSCPSTSTTPKTTTSLPFGHGKCTVTEFQCENHPTCIPLQWKCDGTNDCGDHSDEYDCQAPTTSGNSSTGAHTCFNSIFQYNCNNGLCILSFFECDGDNDCGDWSDERHCQNFPDHHNHPGCFYGNGFDYAGTRNYTKSGRTCQKWLKNSPHKPHYWPQDRDNNYCRNPDNDGYGPWCYTTDPKKRWEYCGIPRCANSSKPIVPAPTPEPNQCQDGYYSCGQDKCIPDRWVCDGEDDCDNQADEDWCNFKCDAALEMMCKNDRCILKTLMCNDANDCGDNTDEASCTHAHAPCNSNTEFRCPDDGKCIAKSKVCNNYFDCPDHSDEHNCTWINHFYLPSMLPCADSGKYIHVTDKCNYLVDCPDARDEIGCTDHIIPFLSVFDCSNYLDDSACERLDWKPPQKPVPSTLTSQAKYRIYYSETFISSPDEDSMKNLPAISPKITETTAKIKGLKFNQLYYAYITISINGVILPFQQSNSIRFRTVYGKPKAPTHVEAMDETITSSGLYYVSISWNSPSGNNDGFQTYYARVTDKNKQNSTYKMYVDNCARCRFGLNIKQGAVTVHVLANNKYYNSSWSEPLQLCVGCIKKPKLTAIPYGSYGCNLSWTIENPLDIEIANFSVLLQSDNNIADRRIVAAAKQRSLTLDKLRPQTKYDIRIAAWTEDSMSSYSDFATINLAGPSPISPYITSVKPNSTTSFVISWKTTKNKSPSGYLFEVSWNEQDNRDPNKKVTKVSGYSTVVQHLPSNVAQIFKVRVIQPYIGAYSPPVFGTPLYDYSEAPRNLEASARPDHVTGIVSWDRPTDGGIVSLNYILTVTDLGTNKAKSMVVNETKSTLHISQVISHLVPNTHYNVSVRVNTKDSNPAVTTFYDGIIPGPHIERAEPLGANITNYVIIFSIDPTFKNFYDIHASKIQSWICNGTSVKSPLENATLCKEQPDVSSKENVIELPPLVPNNTYRIFLRGSCDSIHECGFSHYDLFVDGSRHIIVDTAPSSSFPLTTTNIVAVAAPIIVLVLILIGIIVYLQIRKKRLSDAYRGFVASHYDPQSGEAIFVSNGDDADTGLALDDDDDAETPLITGFADDEPLIVA